MKKIFFLLISLFPYVIYSQLPPEPDPHRGMYLDRFVKKKLNSNDIDPVFSILSVDTNSDGIFEKEDAYLEYVCENHISYIALYDLHQITGGSTTAWNENTSRYENLEVHLCRFMEKARNQYGVTQIGGVVGSVSAVWDLEDYMSRYPVAPGCTTCQADFDVIVIENEFWGDCTADLPDFISIMDAMYTMKENYNSAHPDNRMTTDAYLAFLDHCISSPGATPTAQVIDGCKNCSPFPGCSNPHPRKIDRVLYSILSKNPYQFSFAEINSFEHVESFDSTDFHPMFYSESQQTSGTYDFYGPWLAAAPLNTIFVAEDYFYYWWRMLSGAAFGTPRLNDVQPGGAHWFSGSHMVGRFDHPMVVQVFEPYCTNDSSKIVFNYLGPDESGTDYKFFVKRDSDNVVVYPKTGNAFAGVSLSTVNNPGFRTINFADTILFPELYLPKGEYTAHIELAYNHSTGCVYSREYKFLVDNKARLQLAGDSAFCNGHHTFLTTSTGAASYSWFRNGEPVTGATSNILKVVDGGDYYCVLNGGPCPSITDTIHITVHPLPVVEINATCNGNGTVTLKTDLSPANPLSTAISGAGGITYYWNTGATTDQITVNSNVSRNYRLQVTDPYSGCSIYRDLSVADSLLSAYTAVITVDQQATGCANDGKLTASLTPAPGIYDPIRYLWSNGETTATITGLPAGTYSVTAKVYNHACSFYSSVAIGTPATHVINGSVTQSACSNSPDGSVVLNPSGGPFLFSWANIPDENGYSSSNQNQLNLFPGIYEVTVTDTNGCSSVHSFNVGAMQDPVIVSTGNVSSVTGCATNQNGSATVQITGGTGPYSQNWINNFHSVSTGTNLFAGSYKVTVTDQAGCTGYSYVHIPSDYLPISYELLDSSHTKLICDSMSDGQLYLCIHGGVQQYSVNSPWTISGNMASATNLYAGNYPITITDSAGCFLTDTFTVDSAGLILAATAFHTHCTGCADGSIHFIPLGGTPPYAVSWSPQTGMLMDTTIEQLPAGSYTICVTDSNQCTYCEIVNVLDDPLLVNEFSENEVYIYPNPSKGTFTIRFSKEHSGFLRMEIVDLYGRKNSINIKSDQQLTNLSMDTGLYFLTFYEGENEIAKTRVVVLE